MAGTLVLFHLKVSNKRYTLERLRQTKPDEQRFANFAYTAIESGSEETSLGDIEGQGHIAVAIAF